MFDIAQAHGIEIHLYANNTQLYHWFDLDTDSSQASAAIKIEACIADVKTWMVENKLKLNDDKTEVIVFSSYWQKHKVKLSNIQIGEHSIVPSSTAKNLGVIFDSHLFMDKQVGSICRKGFYHLRRIGKLRKFITPDALLSVMHAYVSSQLDCNNALLQGISGKLLGKIQLVQNSAARMITRSRRSSPATPDLIKLHWLPIRQRISFKTLILTFKCISGDAPVYLRDLIKVKVPERNLRSSEAIQLQPPSDFPRTKRYGERAFMHSAPCLWNALPRNIRKCNLLSSFKKKLKMHLFKKFLKSKPKYSTPQKTHKSMRRRTF